MADDGAHQTEPTASMPSGPFRHRRVSRRARRPATTPAKADSKASMSASVVDHPTDRRRELLGVHAHGLQHRRGLQGLRRARRARVGGDARLVEPEQHRLGLDPFDAQADDVGEPVDRVAEGLHARRPRRAARSAGRTATRRPPPPGRASRPSPGRPPRPRSRLPPPRSPARPGGPAPARPPPGTDRSRSPRRTIKDADPRRAAQLVGRDRHQVGAEPLEVEGNVTGRRHRIDVGGYAQAAAAAPPPRATGWTVPTSWLAHWQWTRAGSRPKLGAALSEGLLDGARPRCGPGRRRGWHHRARPGRGVPHRRVLDTAEQATGPGSDRVAPQTAALMASVPPEVNTTWRGRALEQARYLVPGLLQCGPDHASLGVHPARVGGDAGSAHAAMAARASGRSGVVEAWSR